MSGFDPESRELCPDGTCIGLIGADGRCKVCGARGEAPRALASETPDAEDAAALADEPGPDEPEHGEPERAKSDEAGANAGDDEFATRRLCPDGLCIGIIGKDGRCGECGTAAP